MATLGKKYTVVYESKNLRTGITGITTTIKKPDGSTIGAFSLTEYSEPEFSGIYYAEFNTSVNDPVGEWIGVINSPNEGNYSRAYRISFFLPESSSITVQDIVDGVWNAQIGDYSNPGSTGETLNLLTLLDIDNLLSSILKSDVIASIQASESITGNVELEQESFILQIKQEDKIVGFVEEEEDIASSINVDAEIIGV